MPNGILLNKRLGISAAFISGLVTFAAVAVLMQVGTADASHSRDIDAHATVIGVSEINSDGTVRPLAGFRRLDFPLDPDATEFTAVFSGGRKQSDAMKQWIRECLNNRGDECRKDLTIQILGKGGNEVLRTINFFECFPVSFSAPNLNGRGTNVVHWTIEVRVNRWESA